MSNKICEIKRKLCLLEGNNNLFYTKHSQKEIEKKIGLKENTLHFYLYKLKISLLQKRNQEFINYIYSQSLKDLTLEKIQKDLNFSHKQSASRKIKKFFGMSLEELKKKD